MLVDVSHAADSTALDAIRLSRAPVIASHSSVRALCDVPRNLPDKIIKAIAATGGVVQIVAFPTYLKKSSPAEQAERDAADAAHKQGDMDEPAYLALLDAIEEKYGAATVDDLIDHVDHVVRLVGVDHVGLSSDFGGGGGIVGWRDARETANVTAALSARGYAPADIAKIWGGNLLRTLGRAEAVAKTLQASKQD
ncbi:MAG: hypothetical protein D6782_05555 [Alphaproteobacteria bacterium]|nr:MAG: hypothetical protein D6782_05555 [Alphaproteobacteria bacterium]